MEKLLLIVLLLSPILCCELFFTTPISFYLIVNFLNVVVFWLNEIDFNFLSAQEITFLTRLLGWKTSQWRRETGSLCTSHIQFLKKKTGKRKILDKCFYRKLLFKARHNSTNNSTVLNSLSQNLQVHNQILLSAKESWSGGNWGNSMLTHLAGNHSARLQCQDSERK